MQTWAEDPAILLQVGTCQNAMVKTFKKHLTRFLKTYKKEPLSVQVQTSCTFLWMDILEFATSLDNWWWPSSRSREHICYTRSTKEPGSQLHGYDAFPWAWRTLTNTFFEPPVPLQSDRFYHQLRGVKPEAGSSLMSGCNSSIFSLYI